MNLGMSEVSEINAFLIEHTDVLHKCCNFVEFIVHIYQYN